MEIKQGGYINWIFIKDIGFYAILGLLTFVPLVYFVASLMRKSFAEARELVKNFLKEWAAIAPADFLSIAFNIAGISTLLFLLGFMAYSINRFGDATMPYTSKAVAYFGSEEVRWSIEHGKEWRNLKFNLREVTGIKGDRQKWEELKAQMGKYDARLFRTVFYLFVVIFVAGIIDIASRTKFRNRGICILIIAAIGIITCQGLWVERTENYIDNLYSRYKSEYLNQHGELPPLPPSFP